MSVLEDVLYADAAITQDPSLAVSRRETSIDSSSFSRSGNFSSPRDETEKTPAETPNSMTLSDFMGWNMEGGREM